MIHTQKLTPASWWNIPPWGDVAVCDERTFTEPIRVDDVITFTDKPGQWTVTGLEARTVMCDPPFRDPWIGVRVRPIREQK